MDNEQLIIDTLLELKSGMGRLEGSVTEIKDAHAKRLEDLEGSEKWQWRAQLFTVPVVFGLHYIGNKIGLIKH